MFGFFKAFRKTPKRRSRIVSRADWARGIMARKECYDGSVMFQDVFVNAREHAPENRYSLILDFYQSMDALGNGGKRFVVVTIKDLENGFLVAVNIAVTEGPPCSSDATDNDVYRKILETTDKYGTILGNGYMADKQMTAWEVLCTLPDCTCDRMITLSEGGAPWTFKAEWPESNKQYRRETQGKVIKIGLQTLGDKPVLELKVPA